MSLRLALLMSVALALSCGGTTAGGADASADASAQDGAAQDGATTDSQLGDSGACGTRTGMRGLTMRSVMVAGLERTYLVYLPEPLSATQAVPFVYVFHGYTMSGQDMYNMTGYSALADSDGFAVVFPDGQGGPDSLLAPWNVANPGQMVCGAGEDVIATGDDFAFMDAMKADVLQDQCLDTAHVFSSGFSMGGYFTHHVGCYRSDVRAISPHSGGTIADLSVCTTGHVPVVIFHGTADSVIDAACDDPTVPPDTGFPASATLWAQKNGCQNTYSTTAEDGMSGSNGQCYLYDGCPADGQVELCTFTGMDHCWAGGTAAGSGGNACPSYASATALQWGFFKTYAW